MIDISPKALRFARLAAEQQAAFASDPQIAVIKSKESCFTQKSRPERVGHYVKISEKTADFCLRAVTALLQDPIVFESSEWDGNDFAFMSAATKSLRDQLMHSNAQTY
jgi:hypothetical protein